MLFYKFSTNKIVCRLFKILSSGLFLKYSYKFTNFNLEILVKYILIKRVWVLETIIINIIIIIIIVVVVVIVTVIVIAFVIVIVVVITCNFPGY